MPDFLGAAAEVVRRTPLSVSSPDGCRLRGYAFMRFFANVSCAGASAMRRAPLSFAGILPAFACGLIDYPACSASYLKSACPSSM